MQKQDSGRRNLEKDSETHSKWCISICILRLKFVDSGVMDRYEAVGL
jgi:hypothetical protein